MKNVFRLLSFVALSLLFVQCQPDEITITPVGDENLAVDTITVGSNITADVTWTSGNIYLLDDMVVVESNATLTIEPCVVVKATNGTTGLIVSKGAKIDAQGTEDCPIVFTSAEDMLAPGEVLSPNLTGEDVGLWSGIFILGDAQVSSGGAAGISMPLLPQSPVFDFGGSNSADNSGTLSYVSIRHTGFEIGPDEVPCGLTLGGVGNSTTISHVELYANADDGFKLLGGSVNPGNVITSGFLDDAYDIDQGYAGTMNNLIGIGVGDNNSSLELDGGEGAENPSFTIRNASFQGSQTGEDYIDFQRQVNCLIENAYFFGFDENSRVKLDSDNDADNWLAGLVDVAQLQFKVSHLSSGNTTTQAIFVDAGGDPENAFTTRLPDAEIVSAPTTGADKTVFTNWTVAGQLGALEEF